MAHPGLDACGEGKAGVGLKFDRPLSEAGVVLPTRLLQISLLAMTGLHLAAPGAQWTTTPGSLAGLLPIVAGWLLHSSANRRFRRLGATAECGAEPSVLVTKGVFRMSRNPMALGMVLGVFGYAVLLGTASPLLVIPAFLLLLERLHVRPEERQLESAFGEDYDRYCGDTARWI